MAWSCQVVGGNGLIMWSCGRNWLGNCCIKSDHPAAIGKVPLQMNWIRLKASWTKTNLVWSIQILLVLQAMMNSFCLIKVDKKLHWFERSVGLLNNNWSSSWSQQIPFSPTIFLLHQQKLDIIFSWSMLLTTKESRNYQYLPRNIAVHSITNCSGCGLEEVERSCLSCHAIKLDPISALLHLWC